MNKPVLLIPIKSENSSGTVRWNVFKTILGIFLITFYITGCESSQVSDEYKNQEVGIEIVKPHSWNVTFISRIGELVITTPKSQDNRDSVRIEIIAKSCNGVPFIENQSKDNISKITKDVLNDDIERIRDLYGLDTISVLLDPIDVNLRNYEAFKAIVKIPTTAMKDDSMRIQVGIPNSELFQNITIYTIKSPNIIKAFIYEGSNNAINSQAEQLINNLKQSC